MGKIRVLSDTVANKIAAGEVVERPASVVKELIENSLDAGATQIRIDVDSGGRKLIRVADDGCGMLRDDEFPGPAGTTITVRDLFFNVPARKKFLRSDQTELAHIASLATHYSLAHPAKTFQLIAGGSELLHVTPVSTLRERVYQVFGSQTLDELVELGSCQRELLLPPPPVAPSEAIAEYRREPDDPPSRVFRLTGFISRPQVQKGNRNSIFTFVNSRLIRDRLLLHAISSAYHNLMPHACYPFALLFLECDCEEVDVNVHPSKTEVRFRHQSFVHDFIRDTLRDRLIESRPAPAFTASAGAQPAPGLPFSEFSQMLDNEGPAEPAASEMPVAPAFTLRPERSPEPRFDFGSGAVAVGREHSVETARSRVPDTHGEFPPGTLPAFSSSLSALADLRPLGQIHESFIIAAGRDGLWIIDQHVAHERILFERVLQQRASGRVETQALLMPLILQLTAEQQIEYARIADELQSIGFETEPFGARTIAVKAAPAAVPVSDLEKLMFEILETAEGEMRGLSMDDIRRNIAASIACRAAIKINMRLDQNKMEWLLAALAATDCPMSCPHGRPIALQYPTREILKAFHRI